MKKQTIFAFLCLILLVFLKCFAFFILYPVKYQNIIVTQSDVNSISAALVAGIINAESGYNPNCISSAGAIGLMQLMPATARYMCEMNDLEYDPSLLYNAKYNINLGCAYLKYLKNKFNDPVVVLCAYNAGETKVANWLKNQKYSSDGKTLDKIPYSQTAFYVTKVFKCMKHYQIHYFEKP